MLKTFLGNIDISFLPETTKTNYKRSKQLFRILFQKKEYCFQNQNKLFFQSLNICVNPDFPPKSIITLTPAMTFTGKM